MEYEKVIGLEIHAELATDTKAFCSCGYSFGAEVNTQCCPGCIGMPGTLPSLNKRVVEFALRLGHATNSKINYISSHDRKNYFYPDLAKGYQVTQAITPICQDGYIEFYHKGQKRKVRLTRIHIEEDTAKLLHEDAFKGTLLDFNRSGVALLEIVSEPDIRSAEETKDYLEAVKNLLVCLGISSGKMQEGVLRCDVNVSVRPFGQKEYGTRVEMKNVNTFSGAMQAVEYETNRQIELLENGQTFHQETRRWDENKCVSISMRSKENAADYRYFGEADLVPLIVDEAWSQSIKDSLPELPVARLERYLGIGVGETEAKLLTERPSIADFFDRCISKSEAKEKVLINWLFGYISEKLNKEGLTFDAMALTPQGLCQMTDLIENGIISNDMGKAVVDEMFKSGEEPAEIVERLSLGQINDRQKLTEIINDVLSANAKSVQLYRDGKTNLFGFFIGQAMKITKGRANPKLLNEILNEEIGKKELS